MKHLQVYTEGNTDSNMSTALYNFSPFLKDTGMRKDLSKGWRTSQNFKSNRLRLNNGKFINKFKMRTNNKYMMSLEIWPSKFQA